MASIVIAGDTSGTVTLTAPAVAGTVTLTLPTASGTPALTSSTLTSGRVPFAGASGVLQDSANITYNGVTLTALAAGVPLFIAATNTNSNQLGFSNAANAAPHFYIGTPAVNTLQFANGSGVELARINSTGNIVLKGGNAGADGVGVTFPPTQVASTNAQTLDDYEEGTWTAAITCGTSGTITLDPSYDTLKYTKVGRVVTLTGFVYVSAVSSPVGTVTVTGLPFVNGNANGNSTGVSAYVYGLNTASNLIIGIDKSASSINTRTFSAGVVTTSIAGNFFATSGFLVNLTYFID